MNKKEQRKMNKLKKQIGELFVMGEISQEEAETIAAIDEKLLEKRNGSISSGKLRILLSYYFICRSINK